MKIPHMHHFELFFFCIFNLLTMDHRVTGLRNPVTRSTVDPVTVRILAVTTASFLVVTVM